MILIQPPSWHKGSLGDDAVLLGYHAKYGVERTRCMISHNDPINDYEMFEFIACDTLDGRWGHGNLYPSLMAIEKVPTNILNASWSKNPNPKSIVLLSSFLEKGGMVYFRDTVSLDRARKIFGDRGLCYGGEDYAFSVPIIINKRQNDTLICPCVHSLNDIGVIKALDADYAIVHDYRGGDHNLCASTFPHSAIFRPQTVSDVYNIVSTFNKVITGRIHLGIAASRCGIETIVVDYNDKAEGIFDGRENVTIVHDQKELL